MHAETWSSLRTALVVTALVVTTLLATAAAREHRRSSATARRPMERWLFVRNSAAEPIVIGDVTLFGAPVLPYPALVLPRQCLSIHLVGESPPFSTDKARWPWRVRWIHEGRARWAGWVDLLQLEIAGDHATTPTRRTCVPCGSPHEFDVGWDPRLADPEAPGRGDRGAFRILEPPPPLFQ